MTQKTQKISAKAPSQNRVRHGSPVVDAVIIIVMTLLGLATLYPVLFVISNSLSDPQEVMRGSITLLPKGFSLDAYRRVLSSTAMIRAFFNSIVFTATVTLLNLAVSMLGGFALSKRNLPGKKLLNIYLIIPMWFGAGLIPSFITVTRLGLYNTIWAIILPSALSVYNVILARTFIRGIPSALIEAAEIDGATVPQMFFQIILPLSKAIMAVLGLYTALGAWNNWFSFVIYLPGKSELHPLQYFLVKALLWGNAQSTLDVDMTDFASAAQRMRGAAVAGQMKYAVVVVATVPIMCVYPFVQKYFVKGVMLGSLKE